MPDNCITLINYYPLELTLNRCENTISYEVNSKLDAHTLIDMSNHCFDLYKNRLGENNEATYEIGTLEYETIHKTLIRALASFNPYNLSFSISSSNPSLHFVVRLPENISVFVETYINPEGENSTYIQVLDDEHPILQAGGSYSECLKNMENTLATLFPAIVKTYVEL